MGKIMLNNIPYSGVNTAPVNIKKYIRTITSNAYGWFTFVDENGDAIKLDSLKVPLYATAITQDNDYYTSMMICYNSANSYLFHAVEINKGYEPSYDKTTLTLTFEMAYIDYADADSDKACVCGCFIETSQILVPQTSYSTATGLNYTATKDCAVFIDVTMSNTGIARYSINGIQLYAFTANANYTYQTTIFLRKGQTLTSNHSTNPSQASYVVYGVSPGLDSVAEVRYSTNERAIGTWIDGSTLYEKTLLFNNKIASQDNTSELLHGVSNIGSVKFVDRVYIDFQGGQNWIPAENHIWVSTNKYYISWAVGSSAILLQSSDSQLSFDANPNRSYLFVIRYTKSST